MRRCVRIENRFQPLFAKPLASRPSRRQPGYDKGDDFRPGFKALKEIGYRDYCSYECGIEGKKEIEIPKSIAFLKQQWNEA